MAPIVPIVILGIGALAAFAFGKKKTPSTTATGTVSLPSGSQATGSISIPNPTIQTSPSGSQVVVPPGMTQAQVATNYQAEVLQALEGLNVDPNTFQITKVPEESAIHYASGLVARMRASGFRPEADTLDKFVQDAIKKRNQVTPAAPVVVIPGIPASLQAEVDNAIRFCKDPAKLRAIADALAKLPGASTDPTIQNTIQMLQQMANQLQAQQIAATAIQQAGAILTNPNPPPVNISVPSNTTSQAPQTTVTPSAVLAAPKSTVEIAADQMISHLKRLQLSQGSVTKAKGKEDKNLIKKFQTLAKITADGVCGPGTLVAAASFGQYELPLVMYWPKGATTQKVYDYRNALESLANKIEATNQAGAAALRSSASRERGQAGVINGPLKN